MATRRPALASSPRANLRPAARREWAARRLGFGGQPRSQRPRVERTRFPDRCAACLTSGGGTGFSLCAVGFSPQPSLREKLRAPRRGRAVGSGSHAGARSHCEARVTPPGGPRRLGWGPHPSFGCSMRRRSCPLHLLPGAPSAPRSGARTEQREAAQARATERTQTYVRSPSAAAAQRGRQQNAQRRDAMRYRPAGVDCAIYLWAHRPA